MDLLFFIHYVALLVLIFILFLKALSSNSIFDSIDKNEFSTKLNTQDLQFYFNKTATEINFLKGIQWNIIYYSVLLFGGVFAISQIDIFKNVTFYYVFIILNLVIYIYSIYMFFEIQYKLKELRLTLFKTKDVFRDYNYYKDNFDYYDLFLKDKSFLRDPRIFIPFIAMPTLSLFFLNFYYIHNIIHG